MLYLQVLIRPISSVTYIALSPHDFLKSKTLHFNFGGGAFWRPGPSQPLMVKYLQFGPQIIGFNTQVARGVLGRVHQASQVGCVFGSFLA